MRNITRLPIRPKSFPDESAASLLLRASEMNGHENIFSLCGKKLIKKNKLAIVTLDPDKFGKILRSIGLDETNELLLSIRFAIRSNSSFDCSRLTVPYHMRRADLTTYCPECLAEAPYWRNIWQLHFYTICSNHGSYLINHCPQCSIKINVRRFSLVLCDNCSYDLRQTISQKTDPASMLWFSKLVNKNNQSKFDYICELYCAMKYLLMSEYEKMYFIYLYGNGSSKEKAKGFLIKHLIQTAHESHPRMQLLGFIGSTNMWKILMEDVLKAINHEDLVYTEKNIFSLSKVDTCRFLNCDYGYLSRCLAVLQINAHPDKGNHHMIGSSDVKRLLFLGAELPGASVFKLSTQVKEYSQFDLILREVAAELRLKMSVVLSLIRDGHLLGFKVRLNGGVPHWVVNTREVDRFKKSINISNETNKTMSKNPRS